jgi:hypothetical protein
LEIEDDSWTERGKIRLSATFLATMPACVGLAYIEGLDFNLASYI